MLEDNEEALRQFNSQWDAQHSTDDTKPPIDGGGSGGGNLLDSVQNQPIVPNTQPYVPAAIPTTGDQCPQCNTMHPPIRPGEICPVAKAAGTTPEVVQEVVQPTPVVQEVVDAVIPQVAETPATPAPEPLNTETVSEPAPLAQNNIPTEIHVNKYLASWGDQIQAHCKANGIQNVKKLMRHITIEITDFLENYKGK